MNSHDFDSQQGYTAPPGYTTLQGCNPIHKLITPIIQGLPFDSIKPPLPPAKVAFRSERSLLQAIMRLEKRGIPYEARLPINSLEVIDNPLLVADEEDQLDCNDVEEFIRSSFCSELRRRRPNAWHQLINGQLNVVVEQQSRFENDQIIYSLVFQVVGPSSTIDLPAMHILKETLDKTGFEYICA